MPATSCFFTMNRAIRVANDNGTPPPVSYHLPPLAQAGTRRNPLGEMVLFVEEGIVEFMIGGASGIVAAGGYVRIPTDIPYAYRNAGDETARLVSRPVTPDRSTPVSAA